MAPLVSASMGVLTLQAYFSYSKQSACVVETLWTSVLVKEECWHQP